MRPSMGSWLTYGLGSENQNLPGFVVLCPGGYPIQESQNWQSGFLRHVQGTYVDSQHTQLDRLIENITNHYPVVARAAASVGFARRSMPGISRRSGSASWKPASRVSNWPTGCKWMRPMHLMFPASRKPSGRRMEKTPRAGRC